MYIRYFANEKELQEEIWNGMLQEWVMRGIENTYDLFGNDDVTIDLESFYDSFEIHFEDGSATITEDRIRNEMNRTCHFVCLIIKACYERYQREHQMLKDIPIKEDTPSVTIKADNVGFTVHEIAYTQREVFDIVNRMRKDGCTKIRYNFADCDKLPKLCQ